MFGLVTTAKIHTLGGGQQRYPPGRECPHGCTLPSCWSLPWKGAAESWSTSYLQNNTSITQVGSIELKLTQVYLIWLSSEVHNNFMIDCYRHFSEAVLWSTSSIMLLTVFQSFYNYCSISVLVKIICMYTFKIDQSKFPNPCTQGMKVRISDYVNKHDRCGMTRLEIVRSKVKSRWSLALNTCVMNNDTTNGKTPCRSQNNCPQVHGLKHYRLLPYMLSKMHSNTQNHCFYTWSS